MNEMCLSVVFVIVYNGCAALRPSYLLRELKRHQQGAIILHIHHMQHIVQLKVFYIKDDTCHNRAYSALILKDSQFDQIKFHSTSHDIESWTINTSPHRV